MNCAFCSNGVAHSVIAKFAMVFPEDFKGWEKLRPDRDENDPICSKCAKKMIMDLERRND